MAFRMKAAAQIHKHAADATQNLMQHVVWEAFHLTSCQLLLHTMTKPAALRQALWMLLTARIE